MNAVTTEPPSFSALGPGRVVLTPMAEAAASAAGVVLSYDAGPAGLAVRLISTVTSDAAQRLDGHRVWVRANADGRLVAFQAVARRSTETSLETDGITAPVEEHRRAHLRAATHVAVELRVRSGDAGAPTSLAGHTLDLSRGGSRLQLSDGSERFFPVVGAPAEVTLDLGRPVVASGQVLRADPASRQAVVRFTALAGPDADLVDRHVLGLVV
jgi:hypothetical protein